jgi:Raf kinase inhibitor-like YbhB/YbcL family protein
VPRWPVLALCSLALVVGGLAWAAAPFRLTSPVFKDGRPIPSRYTCAGANNSPPLSWTAPPSGTKSLAIEVEDPDAPLPGGFTHWLGWGIKPTARGLAAGQAAAVSGASGRGAPGYTGPCPPSGVHHYHFTLYALDVSRLPLRRGADRAAFKQALSGHVLARAKLIGTFAAG